MMQLWKRLFGSAIQPGLRPSPEEALLHLEIYDLRQCYDCELAHDRAALDHVLAEFDLLLKAEDSVATKMMRESGWSAGDTLATALAGFAIEELLSGRRHGPDGELDASGEAFLRVFDQCLSALTSSGRLLPREAEEEAADLRATMIALGREGAAN